MLNTLQIDRILKRKVEKYLGTFSSNHLPHETGIFVSNTDPCNRDGTHWIAIYISVAENISIRLVERPTNCLRIT
jgi:hypothetical protein